MKKTLIESDKFILTFDLDFNDKCKNCTTSTKEFINRLVKDLNIDENDEEYLLIVEDIIFASVFTALTFLEKVIVKDQQIGVDEEQFKEFKAFYKQLSVAETKVDISSDYKYIVLSILSSIIRKIKETLDYILEGQNKKILDLSYVNSKIETDFSTAHLYLAIQIKLD